MMIPHRDPEAKWYESWIAYAIYATGICFVIGAIAEVFGAW